MEHFYPSVNWMKNNNNNNNSNGNNDSNMVELV